MCVTVAYSKCAVPVSFLITAVPSSLSPETHPLGPDAREPCLLKAPGMLCGLVPWLTHRQSVQRACVQDDLASRGSVSAAGMFLGLVF